MKDLRKLAGANRLMGDIEGDFDGHAHVFRADLPMAASRRYSPKEDATLIDFIGLLRRAGLDGAILIQPSFLGADNTYLFDALFEAATYEGMTFRGVAVLDPDRLPNLGRLKEAGFIGVRLNVVGEQGRAFEKLTLSDDLLRRIDRMGWHLELHCEGAYLAPLLAGALDRCATVVVDHFGLPEAGSRSDCPGQKAILAAPRGRVFVKASAPYRVFPDMTSKAAADHCLAILKRLHDHLGPDQLLWGSDWPWTRFEAAHSYSDLMAWKGHWLASL